MRAVNSFAETLSTQREAETEREHGVCVCVFVLEQRVQTLVWKGNGNIFADHTWRVLPKMKAAGFIIHSRKLID